MHTLDLVLHRAGHASVRLVSLYSRAEAHEHVRLSVVHLHQESLAVGKRHYVLGANRIDRGQRLPSLGRSLKGVAHPRYDAGLVSVARQPVAQLTCERLLKLRGHPVTLNVPVCAEIADDLEDVGRALELPDRRLMATDLSWNRLVRTRLGIGDGISYTGEHLDIETQNYNSENKTNRSRLLNYLDISLSLNLKDITDMDQLENSYIGVGISHRSGIQGLINDVHGGSNFATIFIEWEI